MRELGPDRLSDDGRYLVLREPGRPELFRVPVDRRLAALVEASPRARGRAHGQMEITMESSLTPREIQTRIRRGESPDQVAESAGVPTEQIEGFATPVLAERAYMAEQARTTTIRRRHAAGPGVLLGAAVDESVAAQGGVPEEAAWDAWRREDGRWTVQVFAPDALEPARFCFDAKSRYVLPDDEAARLLVGDVAAPEATDMAIAAEGIPPASQSSHSAVTLIPTSSSAASVVTSRRAGTSPRARHPSRRSRRLTTTSRSTWPSPTPSPRGARSAPSVGGCRAGTRSCSAADRSSGPAVQGNGRTSGESAAALAVAAVMRRRWWRRHSTS